jgi:hypothetical protein
VTSAQRIDCLVPGLCAPFDGVDTTGAPALSSLSLLLGKGRALSVSPTVAEAQACALFGVRPDAQGELPHAALSWLADTGERPDTALLRADPVYLRADQTRLRLFHAQQLGIGRDEADALTDTLNRHFAEDGIEFSAPVPQRWYARLADTAVLRTTPLSAVNGRPVEAALPTGADASVWHRRFNEVQMLFHDHPVNAARRARRHPPVNSVWFWGGAALPAQLDSGYREIVSDNVVVAGLARLGGAAHTPTQAFSGGDEGAGRRLWCFESLEPWAAFGDYTTWLDRLAALDARVFNELARCLRRSGCEVRLYTGADRDFLIRSADLLRFWKRPRRAVEQLASGCLD